MDTIKSLGKKTNYVYNSPNASQLEWFENPGKNYRIDVECTEFTSLCPKTGQPDFATLLISYIPDKRCVESKSLKLYLFSFRQYGAFHESCVNKIADDLCAIIHPKWLKVVGRFNVRGGIAIWPVAERGKS